LGSPGKDIITSDSILRISTAVLGMH
jgi:hypothetical protein